MLREELQVGNRLSLIPFITRQDPENGSWAGTSMKQVAAARCLWENPEAEARRLGLVLL